MGKIFKNMKMGVKISLTVSLILILSLGSVMMVTLNTVQTNTKNDTANRLGELANARATYVAEYFNEFERYFGSAAKLPVFKEALENPDDPEKIQAAQSALEGYIQGRGDTMEGLFLADLDTKILCHTVKDAIGGYTATGDAVQERKESVESAENMIYLRGVVASTATGDLVASVYAGVCDDNGNLLGYVGGGTYINELKEAIYGMDLNGYNDTQIYVLNVSNNNYTFSPNDEEDGTELNENDALIIADALANNSGVVAYTANGVAYDLAYEYIPSVNMVL
ncbi:MAG: cache domain-containing protein, partial [Lachnospiraceae bacterium]|nr:cache domain-containing protein [Lachnospiraceae bacterium]